MEEKSCYKPFFTVSQEFGHDSGIVDLTGCGASSEAIGLRLTPSLDDFHFFSVSEDGHIQCWDSSSKDCLFEFYTSTAISGGVGDPVQSLAATLAANEGEYLYTGTRGGLLNCYDTISGNLLNTFEPHDGTLRHLREITDFRCIKVHKNLLLTGQQDASNSNISHTVRTERLLFICYRNCYLCSYTNLVLMMILIGTDSPRSIH